ncbi:MAG: protein-glutamate O-methyltransferase CheR [Anaerolineae bacterium]|nr:protein-glutamate O-methyltransferase CheR [Anaerolineae bacterium]
MSDRQYQWVYRKIKETTGIDLSAYKSQQAHRRLDFYLRRSGAKSWAEYFRRVEQNPQELQALRNYLTINVSCFFRDPHKFRQLQERILPRLVQSNGRLDMWSAGCSYGAEAYTLAIIADMMGIRYYRVWATDIDQGALARARAGGPYTREDVKNIAPPLVTKYFDRREDGLYVKPMLRRHVAFEEFNLLEDEARSQFDLVVCRNVIIYFSDEAKRKVLITLTRALRPGGVLFLGGTEVIPSALARALGLRPLEISFYGKVAHVMESAA